MRSSSPSKVLLVTQALIGGCGELVVRIASHLAGRGISCCVVYSPERIDERSLGMLRHLERSTIVRSVPLSLHLREGRAEVVRSIQTIRMLACDADVVHAHAAWAGLFARVACMRSSVPVVYSPHGGPFHLRTPLTYAGVAFIERVLARKTQAIVVSSLHESSAVGRLLPRTSRRRLTIIPHGSDGSVKAIPRHCRVVGLVGRLVPEKRFDLALEAFALVAAKQPSIRMLVFGEGPEADSLKDLTRRLGIERSAVFKGFEGSLEEMYGSFDLLLMTSISESFGLTVLEAQGFGRPCVSSDFGSAHERIENGVSGVIIPSSSPKDFADAILALMRDDQSFYRLALGARAAARGADTWDRILPRYRQIYAQLCGSSGDVLCV